ncbi:hypothetical protein [Brevibacillus fortis]|uniref:hypothetical protein n=1 Tax=Brevibacillus fortis TaxID=2126352 RepID=UPI0038FC242F
MKLMKRTILATTLSICTVLAFGITHQVTAKESSMDINSYKEKKVNKEVKQQIIGNYLQIEKSDDGLEEYVLKTKKKNNALKKSNKEGIIATITFAEPLDFDEVKSYIKKHKLEVKQLQSRAKVDNKRITLSSIYNKDVEKAVEYALEGLEEEYENKNVEFVGYTDMYVIVNSKEIDDIEADSHTFLLDASADSHFIKENKKYHPHALTWLLEDLKEE